MCVCGGGGGSVTPILCDMCVEKAVHELVEDKNVGPTKIVGFFCR